MKLDLTLEFVHAGWDLGHVVGFFKDKYPENEWDRRQIYPVIERDIRQRLLGPLPGQFNDHALVLFNDCEISEHNLAKALRACRDIAGQKRLTDQRAFRHP